MSESVTSTRGKSARLKVRDRKIAAKLTAWFEEHQRPLPWRKTLRGKRCAWAALVAEAMLQQTQVVRVVERFEEFMKRFPRPIGLANAQEQEVLRAWQGLGYYRRARHLHQSAKLIVDRLGGSVPGDVRDLLALPGVGRYTAGAIASIAFGRSEPIVDGNVFRVLARLDGQRLAANEREGVYWSWTRAQSLVQEAECPGPFNESLMELGAVVCTPRKPDCSQCPVASHCIAKRNGMQHSIPPARKPPQRRIAHHHAVVLQRANGGEVLLEQRPAIGLWAGMWQVPTLEHDRPMSVDDVAKHFNLKAHAINQAGSFEHQTTHRRIIFHVLAGQSSRQVKGVWRRRDDVDDLPMSNAQRRILREFVGS